ncbi:MAG: membrane protein insertion efficiency factor YidD [Clostridia bacterium]|nr:membrane protein insertion efficiency factor YidD [Clostridia bacterium]MBQ9848622.1 membrane protein insertion efficiency factor YidD [Clostridia bacterium]
MKKLFILPIRFYQKHISPNKPRCCRFTPSCSAYAIEAIEKRGIFVGLLLALYRILRCNPFCKGGYDPVPEKKPRK